jgi:TPR repeat protein
MQFSSPQPQGPVLAPDGSLIVPFAAPSHQAQVQEVPISPASAVSGHFSQNEAGHATITRETVASKRISYDKNNAGEQTEFAKWLLREATSLSDLGTPGELKESMFSEALEILKRMAEVGAGASSKNGHPEAQFFIAECFRKGAFGSPRNLEKAYALYTKASKQGHAPSTYYRGLFNELGHGTRINESKALTLYKTAASAGVTAAALKLGVIYTRGLLKQKPKEQTALMWLKRAAADATVADGTSEGPRNVYALHSCYLLGLHLERQSSPTDRKAAFHFYLDAAEFGYGPSMFKAAMCLRDGIGTEKNENEALRWFQAAGDAGITSLAQISNLPIPT